MKFVAFAAISAALLSVGGTAQAQAVTQTSDTLADVNAGNVTTVTDANGRVTTVTGAPRYANPLAPRDVWQQQNVGGSGSVGITNSYARSGNGSAAFTGVDGTSKADLEIYFSTPIALSSVTALSYDVFRAASSTAAPHLTNSLRLLIGDAANTYRAYLIFEPVYNGFPTSAPIAEDSWYTFSIDTSTTFWSNNNNLAKPAGVADCGIGCFSSLAAWSAANPGYTVLGLSTGTGSGFSGSYAGAVDNIAFTAGGNTRSWNFEVAAVPEPATWAMMIGGIGAIGGTLRRRAAKPTLQIA